MSDVLYQPFPMPGRSRGQIWRYAPEYRRPRHFHPEPELNLVTAGTGRFGVGETLIAVAEGDLLWWRPGQDHVLLEASKDFDLFVVGLTPALSDRVLGEGGAAACGGPTRLRLATATLGRFYALCAARGEHDNAPLDEQQVGDFWRQAHAVRASAPDKHALTRRALARLLERPDLGRSEVARLAHGNPSEVSRHFHRNMGLTLTAYRTRLRLVRFIQLADGGARLLQAALEAGFGSYSQCHRAFKKALRCAPREFFASDGRRQMADAFSAWNPAPEGAFASSRIEIGISRHRHEGGLHRW